MTSPYLYSTHSSRAADMKALVARLNAYGVPPDWRTHVADSSISVTSPKRTRMVKIDAYNVIYIDLINNGVVKSNREEFPNIDKAWQCMETVLNKFLKRT